MLPVNDTLSGESDETVADLPEEVNGLLFRYFFMFFEIFAEIFLTNFLHNVIIVTTLHDIHHPDNIF